MIRRVLIIHTDGNTYNNPTLKCIVDLLLSHSISVDIRYPISIAPMPHIPHVTLLPWGFLRGKFKKLMYNWLNSWWLSRVIVHFEAKHLYKTHYDLVIAVDRIGLIEAGILNEIFGFPFVFFSFEIMFASETSRSFKEIEIKASKNLSHWFVQDEVRAELQKKENDLLSNNYSLIPLASSGSGTLSRLRLRDKLGISESKKVAILIGSLSSWTMIEDIIQSVFRWPDDWVLIVHERYGKTPIFANKIQGDNATGCRHEHEQRIYISNYPTDLVDDLGSILSGISVGLAFYHPDFKSPYTGKNLVHLGLASGKIATYLRYSIPVIMNEIGLYAEMARQYDFGCVVDHVSLVTEKLRYENWPIKANNASRFFNEFLDFENYKSDVWNILNDVIIDKGLNSR